MDLSVNHYLIDEHTPVVGERTEVDLPVEGALPPELNGLFARNSGNPRFPPEGRYHWFDGDGMVHGVHLEGGRASYRNRYIRTRQLGAEEEAGRALWRGILEPVDLSNPLGPIKDTANTDLVWHNGRLLALWWLSGTPQALTVPDLETVGPCTFDGRLQDSMASHAKVDPRTGELVFFGYSITRRPYYHYGVVSADGSDVHLVSLDLPRAHIPHDIAITERFTILLDLPLGWDKEAIARGQRRIGFDREVPGRIGVVPRHGQAEDVRWFEVPPCYVYHTIGAYEDGDEVVLTACRIEDMIPDEPDTTGTVARLDTIHLTPVLYRWRLHMGTGEVRGEALDDRPTEFPRAHDGRWTYNTRYSYNPRVAPRPALSFDGIIKYDLWGGAEQVHEYPEGWYGGEVLYAPRPGSDAEDDGWVLTVLTDVRGKRSELHVLEAADLAAAPVARVTLPWAIPLGFHAAWAPLNGEA